MNIQNGSRKEFTKWIIGIATTCILIYLGVQNIHIVAAAAAWLIGLIQPLVIGFVFALILNVPMRFFEAKLPVRESKPRFQRLRRPLALLLSMVLILGILTGIVSLVIPELVEAVKVLVQGVVQIIGELSEMDAEELSEIPYLGEIVLRVDWDKIGNSLQNWLKNQGTAIMNTAVGTITALIGGLVDLFIALIFGIYILLGKEGLKDRAARMIHAWLPKNSGEWIIHAGQVASCNFRNFVSGQTLEGVILGILCLIGMLILGIPYAPMASALVGVTALIPVVGGFIGSIVGAFMIVTVSPIKAVVFIGFLLILQQVEGNVIYPKVMGNRVNLPAIWILAAVTVGGGAAGPIGMLLAVPTASTLYTLVKEATEQREQQRSTAEKTVE